MDDQTVALLKEKKDHSLVAILHQKHSPDLVVPDEDVQEVDEGELAQGHEDGGEADDDEHVKGRLVTDLEGNQVVR